MRSCVIFFFLIFFSACSEEVLFSDSEFTCSYFVRTGEPSKYCSFEKSFIIEVFAPVFKDTLVRYSRHELESYKVDENEFVLPVIDSHVFCLVQVDYFTNFLKAYKKGSLKYCTVGSNATKFQYSYDDLVAASFTVKLRKLVSNGYITKKYVRTAPRKLSSNQYYFSADYYTPGLIVSGGGYKLQMDPFFKLQEKLNSLGYAVVEDGTANETTMKAVQDFQLKNNLETGALDRKTFQALGLMPEE